MGSSLWTNVGWLVARVTFGASLAFFHGYGKVFGGKVHGLAARLLELGVPAPGFFAWCASLAEFLGGLLVAVGLATRGAASFAALTMVVALYTHRADPPERMELALLYLAAMVCAAMLGSGRFGLDRFIRLRMPIQTRGADSHVG